MKEIGDKKKSERKKGRRVEEKVGGKKVKEGNINMIY
jgi:hypothetical protein